MHCIEITGKEFDSLYKLYPNEGTTVDATKTSTLEKASLSKKFPEAF